MHNRITDATKRRIILWIIGGALVLLQMGAFTGNGILRGSCLMLPLTVAVAMHEKEYCGAAFGLTFGLILDCFSSGVIAFNAILLMIIGCTCGLCSSLIFNRSLKSALLLNLLSGVVYYVFYIFVFKVFTGSPDPVYFFLHGTAIRGFVISLAAIIPFYFIAAFIYRFFNRKDPRKWQKRKTTLE